jgi:hypothetical protein
MNLLLFIPISYQETSSFNAKRWIELFVARSRKRLFFIQSVIQIPKNIWQKFMYKWARNNGRNSVARTGPILYIPTELRKILSRTTYANTSYRFRQSKWGLRMAFVMSAKSKLHSLLKSAKKTILGLSPLSLPNTRCHVTISESVPRSVHPPLPNPTDDPLLHAQPAAAAQMLSGVHTEGIFLRVSEILSEEQVSGIGSSFYLSVDLIQWFYTVLWGPSGGAGHPECLRWCL